MMLHVLSNEHRSRLGDIGMNRTWTATDPGGEMDGDGELMCLGAMSGLAAVQVRRRSGG